MPDKTLQELWQKPLDKIDKDTARGLYNAEPQKFVSGNPPDVALNPLVTGKSILSFIRKHVSKKGLKKLKNRVMQYKQFVPRSPEEIKGLNNYIDQRFNPNNQMVWNPDKKKLENITTTELQKRLKDKTVTGYSYFEQGASTHKSPWRDDLPMGELSSKDDIVYNSKTGKQMGVTSENVQYGRSPYMYSDNDIGTANYHPWGSITSENLGNVESFINRYLRDNPERSLQFNATGGGARVIDTSNKGLQDITSSDYIKNKVKFGVEMNSDPNFVFMDASRDARTYIDFLTEHSAWGNQTAVKRVKLMKEFFNTDSKKSAKISSDIFKQDPVGRIDEFYRKMQEGLVNPSIMKDIPHGGSNIRLDVKGYNILSAIEPNKNSFGHPFSLETLGNFGNKKNTNLWTHNVATQDAMAMKELRDARGMADPANPDLGLGFTQFMEKQFPTLSKPFQEKLRKKFLLGLLPLTLPPDEENKPTNNTGLLNFK
tara:strand:+ start:16306 stop:17757 length:1452 start_codon:yes stop_codon:yes gene_type:complete